MESHEIADLFPLMDKKRLKELAEDIARNGLLSPITTLDGKILDGRNRYRACLMTNQELAFEEFHGDVRHALEYVVSKNLMRRDLDDEQRGQIWSKAAGWIEAEAKERKKRVRFVVPKTEPQKKTYQIGQKQTGLSAYVMKRALFIQHRDPKLADKVIKGEITAREAVRQIRAKEKHEETPRASTALAVRESEIAVASELKNGCASSLLNFQIALSEATFDRKNVSHLLGLLRPLRKELEGLEEKLLLLHAAHRAKSII
jgi:vacuolar-type H+-ATPase subunit I/STV1